MKSKRKDCCICNSKKNKKSVLLYSDFVLCKSCVYGSELSNYVDDSKADENGLLSIINPSINEKEFKNQIEKMMNSNSEDSKIKDEIFTKVKSFNTNIEKEKLNNSLNSMESEDLKSLVEKVRESSSLDDLKKQTEINTIKRELNVPNPKDLFSKITNRVIDQDDAVKTIAMAITKYYCRIKDPSIKKNNIMIMGPTGTGKTELIKSFAKEIDTPVIILDSSSLTATGYKGLSVSDAIVNAVLSATKKNPDVSKRCIIFLDEIDKKASSHNSEHGVGTVIVQQELLTMLQGDTIRSEKGDLDTSNMLVIAAGAFSGISEIVGRRLNHNSIGLNKESNKKNESVNYDKVSTEDLIAYGFIPEFIGRFSTITTTNELTKESLIKILSEKKDSIVHDYKRMFKSMKIDIEFSKEFLERVAEEAVSLKLGARGLQRIMDSKMESIIFNCYDFIGKTILVNPNGTVSLK